MLLDFSLFDAWEEAFLCGEKNVYQQDDSASLHSLVWPLASSPCPNGADRVLLILFLAQGFISSPNTKKHSLPACKNLMEAHAHNHTDVHVRTQACVPCKVKPFFFFLILIQKTLLNNNESFNQNHQSRECVLAAGGSGAYFHSICCSERAQIRPCMCEPPRHFCQW